MHSYKSAQSVLTIQTLSQADLIDTIGWMRHFWKSVLEGIWLTLSSREYAKGFVYISCSFKFDWIASPANRMDPMWIRRESPVNQQDATESCFQLVGIQPPDSFILTKILSSCLWWEIVAIKEKLFSKQSFLFISRSTKRKPNWQIAPENIWALQWYWLGGWVVYPAFGYSIG